MRIVVALVLVFSAPAVADLRVGLHVGGGLEGGMFSREAHPGAVAEAGLSIQALLPGRNWGVGIAVETVGRLTSPFQTNEELKLDLTARWATPDRRMHWGIGAGLRQLTLDGPGAQSLRGMDLVRVDYAFDAARWSVGTGTIAVGLHAAWTFGCYSDRYALMPVGDVKPAMRDIGCTQTISTTYVVGLETSFRFR